MGKFSKAENKRRFGDCHGLCRYLSIKPSRSLVQAQSVQLVPIDFKAEMGKSILVAYQITPITPNR